MCRFSVPESGGIISPLSLFFLLRHPSGPKLSPVKIKKISITIPTTLLCSTSNAKVSRWRGLGLPNWIYINIFAISLGGDRSKLPGLLGWVRVGAAGLYIVCAECCINSRSNASAAVMSCITCDRLASYLASYLAN